MLSTVSSKGLAVCGFCAGTCCDTKIDIAQITIVRRATCFVFILDSERSSASRVRLHFGRAFSFTESEVNLQGPAAISFGARANTAILRMVYPLRLANRFGLLPGALLSEPVAELSSAANVSQLTLRMATPGGAIEFESSCDKTGLLTIVQTHKVSSPANLFINIKCASTSCRPSYRQRASQRPWCSLCRPCLSLLPHRRRLKPRPSSRRPKGYLPWSRDYETSL